MTERGPISGFVGDIPITNSYFSGDLSKMYIEELQARLRRLSATDPDDEDCDEAFENRMTEISAINEEIKKRPLDEKNKQEDEIVVQCVVCGRVRRRLSDWGEIKEYNHKFAQIFCPNCQPKKEEK